MFRKIGENRVESDEGFAIEWYGIHGFRYQEGNKVLELPTDTLGGPNYLLIYTDSIRRWERPHGLIPISKNKQDTIRSNIKKACEFADFPFEIK